MWRKWPPSVTTISNASVRLSARRSWLGWCSQRWSLDWIIVMQHWLVCPKQLLHHYNVSRTQRLAWSSSCAVMNTSLHVCCSCTGFQCDGASASSSNCVALCTLFHTGRVQHIWPTSSSPLVLAVQALVSVQHRRPTTRCRSCAQSSWNMRSRMQDEHRTVRMECIVWRFVHRGRPSRVSKTAENWLFYCSL